ncbi:Protein phosphatase PP2A regulatory subunit B [Gaertneriomyces sp. JEL0708]|nr:Protein phosphatase PP2A regulatory subunit B [Gaertneriomyces sp. JEL0708]
MATSATTAPAAPVEDATAPAVAQDESPVAQDAPVTATAGDETAPQADQNVTSAQQAAAAAAAAAALAAAQNYPAQFVTQVQAPVPPPSGTSNASLYVGDLDPTVTEAQLFDMFNALGPVASIRVCRDAVTRRSLGYAYVNYHQSADAERAIDALNYQPLKDRPMRIMWSQRDPATRRAGAGNIFIKNLDPSIDTRALHETFAAFGPILSCKVAMEGDVSKGYGFVHFEESESAKQAIQHVNGMLLNDRKVFVGLHIPKKERMSKMEEMRARFTNVYVKNLDTEVSEEEFTEMFGKFGEITSITLSKDQNGVSRGFGFVNYASHDEAKAAVDEMHEKEINGKPLYVARAQKKAEREEELRRQYERIREEKLSKYQGVNLYVKNLDDAIDDDKLRQEFSVYGVITSAKVMKDEKTGQSKGFGFVCFSSPEEATKAVTDMNGRLIGSKPIYVALAQRKDVRRQQLSAQMQQRNMQRMQQAAMGGVPGAYPGAPMFYPPNMRQQPGGYVYPQPGMAPRPAGWVGGPGPQRGQPGQAVPAGAYPPGAPMPQQFGVVPQGMARPRQPRQGGRGQPPPAGPNASRPAGPGPIPGQPGQPGVLPPNAGRGGRPAAQYKYMPTARNAPIPGAGPMMPPAGMMPPKPTLNSKMLSDMPADQQKRLLGEALFPMIQAIAPVQAGKVTGMLLEMDNGELLHLLEDQGSLKVKVDEAVEVLEEHMRAAQQSVPEEAKAEEATA